MRMWRIGNPYTLLVEVEINIAFMGNGVVVPHNLKINLFCHPGLPL